VRGSDHSDVIQATWSDAAREASAAARRGWHDEYGGKFHYDAMMKADSNSHAMFAHQASQKAWETGNAFHHSAARNKHMDAAASARDKGNKEKQELHLAFAKEHENAAKHGHDGSTATASERMHKVLARLAEQNTATMNVVNKLVEQRPSAEEICARIGRGRSDR